MNTLKQIVFLSFLFIPAYLSAQVFNSHDKIREKHYADTIPYQIIDNRIVVDALIEGKIRKLLFATAEPHFVLKKHTISTRYEIIGYMKMTDKHGEKFEGKFRSINDIQIGDLHLQNCGASVIDTARIDNVEFDGCIGQNVFQKSIIKIDSRNRQLIITNDKELFAQEKGNTIDFTNNYTTPYIWLSPYDNTVEQVVLDTSSKELFTMSEKHFRRFSKKSNIEEGLIPQDGHEDEKRLLLEYLVIGKFTIPDAKALIKGQTSSLGAGLLNYASIIIDYRKDKITFIPLTQ